MWMLRIRYIPVRHVCMSCMLWYSPYVKCVMWVCSSSECPEESGQVGVSRAVWVCVNAVNSAGVRFERACCHISRMGFSDMGSVVEEMLWIGE
jgi:hypothetical protein